MTYQEAMNIRGVHPEGARVRGERFRGGWIFVEGLVSTLRGLSLRGLSLRGLSLRALSPRALPLMSSFQSDSPPAPLPLSSLSLVAFSQSCCYRLA